MKDFAAIDFETANQQRTSVCSVGIVIVRDGEIADSFYSLIKPEPEYYSPDRSRLLRLRPHHAPQCPGRCRSLCLDSKRTAIIRWRKNSKALINN